MTKPSTDVIARINLGRLPVVRRLIVAFATFLLVVVIGIVLYVTTQGASLGEATYFTIITVFAVGFTEIFPLDGLGRTITGGVIVLGVGSFTLLTVNVIEFLVEGHLLDIVGRRRMQRTLDELDGHMIVCGFGRVGRQVADDLTEAGVDQVVVDIDPERLEMAEERGLPYLLGSADGEDLLQLAGIDRAHGVAAVTQDDAENVLIALTARLQRPDLFIVVRLKDARNTAKALKAGADRVITPTEIGGHRIAALLTKPSVVDFLDVVTHGSDVDMVLEEVRLRPAASLVGKTLITAGVRDEYGVNVVAIRRVGDTHATTRPSPRVPLHAGDVLVIIGRREDVTRLDLAIGAPRLRGR